MRNILSNSGGRVFEMALGMMLIPFLIGKLGTDGFGMIILAESLIRFFDMAMTGLRTGLGRHMGICMAKGDKQEAASFIATGEFILRGILVLFVIAGFILWFYFPVFFRVAPQYKSQVRLFILMMISAAILQARFASSFAVLYSYQRFDLLNVYNALRNITRNVLCFAVYYFFPPRLDYYGFIYFAAIFIEQLMTWIGARHLFGVLSAKIKDFSWAKSRELFSFMFFRTIQSISSILDLSSSMILINKFLGPYFNAVYSISLKFVDILERLIRESLWVAAPSYTELVGRQEEKRLGRIYASLTKLSALISLPACFLILLFGKDLIQVWVGPKFADAVRPMYITVLAYMPALVFGSASGVSTAYAKIKIPSFVVLFCGVANVIIGFYLGIHLGWGLVGFASGILFAYMFQHLFFDPYYACRINGLPAWPFYYHSFLRPLFLSSSIALLIYLTRRVWSLPYVAALTLIVCLPLYLYFSYAWIMDEYDKTKLKDLVSRFTRKKINPEALEPGA